MFVIDMFVSFLSDAARHFSDGYYLFAFGDLCVSGLILLCAGLLAFFVFWLCFNRNYYSEEKTAKAKVVKTSFVPAHGGTHVSPIINSNGSVGTVITSDYEDEQDVVVIKSEEIGRHEIDNEELFESVEKGDTVKVTYKEKYTFWTWDPSTRTFDDYVLLSVKTKDGTEIEV